MKKLYTLLFIFFLTITYSNSQWVTIPDANFAAFLQQNYPQCMNGNLMDTTCSAIVNATSLNCSNKNISDLTGIEYFDNLLSIYCGYNLLTQLPTLPLTLLQLNCEGNLLTQLPPLPNSLTTLVCSYNQLDHLTTAFNNLPPNLMYISCSNNNLGYLPNLPNTITELHCDNNQLYTLPQLPDSLKYFSCSDNNLTNLPTLPSNLLSLECSNNQLVSIPSLPATLTWLDVNSNQLDSLIFLPNSLTGLSCSGNNLMSLPVLPNGLKYLYCNYNDIINLPILPDSLKILECEWNQLSSLPSLPSGMNKLDCDINQITVLPAIPPNLNYLSIRLNQLNSIPPLPNSLRYLNCSQNQLSSLPELPDTLDYLLIYHNPNLTCLPKLKNIKHAFHYYNFGTLGIQCLPNIPNIFGTNPSVSPPLSNYPLCDIFNNPNNCDVYWNISGKVYSDANNNCIDDAGEQSLSNLKLQLFQNGNLIQQVYSVGEGLYSFDTDTGIFTYTVDTTDIPVYATCPTSGFHTSILTPLDSLDYNMDFAMQCKPGFDVGVKSITRTTGQFFPGNTATVKIGAGDMASFYGLTCASGISGNVIVDFTGPITFISEAPGALVPSVIGNTLTYSIPDFGLVNFNSDFRIIVQTDTFAQAGNPVCFTVNVTPTLGDNDATNNSLQHCFTVVNSFDPNAKEVYPEGGIPLNQEWLTYTIHFQNTGNAPAQNIYILDTLDQNLIPETFTLLSFSHKPLTQLFGNVVKFNFPNINLPDSTNDEPNSHGFVQYKVKMVQGLPVGTVISNTAYNYFDFNPPVATNTVSNMVGVTSMTNVINKIDVSVFPNPTNKELNILFNLFSSSEVKIELYNSLGQIVKAISNGNMPTGKNQINFSIADLTKGIYHLRFSVGDDVVMRRVVKM